MCRKFLIDVDEMSAVKEMLIVIGMQEDAVIDITFGTKITEDLLLNSACVCAGTEQISHVFACDRPEITEEEAAAIQGKKGLYKVAFKAKEFFNLVGSVLPLKQKLYLEVGGGTNSYIGVLDNSVRLPIGTLSEDKIPDKVTMKKSDLVLQFRTKTAGLIDAFKAGGSMASAEPNEGRGLNNVVLSVEFKKEEAQELAGMAKIYSSNGNIVTRGVCPVGVIYDPSVMAQLDAYLEKAKQNAYVAPIPKKVAGNLIKLLSCHENAVFAFTENHVFVMIGQRTLYTFTLGARFSVVVYKLDEFHAAPKSCTLVLDAEELKTKVDLLNKLTDMIGEKIPICFNIRKDADVTVTVAGGTDRGTVQIKPVAMETSMDLEINLSGKKVVEVLAGLKKGNVRVSLMQGKTPEEISRCPVEICNGDLEGVAENTGIAILMPVNVAAQKKASAEAPKTPEEENGSENSSEEPEDNATITEE